MKIIQKRLNNTYMRKNDLKKALSKSKSKDKDKNATINLINNNLDNKINLIGNNISINKSNNKTKLVKKNKKVKFAIPINLKSNKPNKINKPIKNNNTFINTNNLNNLKKNIIHRHTKSSFIQGTNLLLNKLIKDISMTNINNNLYNNEINNNINNSQRKKISLNNYADYNTRMNVSNTGNKKAKKKVVSKLNKIKNLQSLKIPKSEKKAPLKNNLLISYRESVNNKDGIIQIKEELKSENKNCDNNNGLSKKFIEAQNIWRKNYFATVIQKLFKGYYFRKNYNKSNKNTNSTSNLSTHSKNNRNTNINNSVIYVKKKAKDNNYLCTSIPHNKEFPTEENNKFLNNKYNNKIPHKIKEIVISIKSKKEFSNDNLFYNNNYVIPKLINDSNYKEIKYAFDLWKKYKDKKEILKKLKLFKKYKNNVFRKSSYEKQRNNTRYKI